jgi:hypothetical protein
MQEARGPVTLAKSKAARPGTSAMTRFERKRHEKPCFRGRVWWLLAALLLRQRSLCAAPASQPTTFSRELKLGIYMWHQACGTKDDLVEGAAAILI